MLNKLFTERERLTIPEVIVDKPIPDVNISHIHMRIKRPKRLVPIPEQQPVVEVKEPSVSKEVVRLRSADSEVKMSPLSQTRASEVLDDMRNSEPVHVVRRSSREEDYNSSGCLILPDQSLLEEYVKRELDEQWTEMKEQAYVVSYDNMKIVETKIYM
ncbi:hypothetical protein NECAME_14143 [Necator americanus]|uniref:Uncharacterized protein n=1 Tax=Necator americanus TaxID=51031 RepID=W2SPM7_NECAM|nr:hypothetical protein NECAME_14143 [Necator americanus]ETN71654.1 hypothetical protein NECAME_14143 [Necator americanus]